MGAPFSFYRRDRAGARASFRHVRRGPAIEHGKDADLSERMCDLDEGAVGAKVKWSFRRYIDRVDRAVAIGAAPQFAWRSTPFSR
jgi:hypothetical protein